MATPDFILALRRHIGTAPLWLSGVTAVVIRGLDRDREVLLVRRSDNGAWTPVTGIIDPGEDPAIAGAREVWEETGTRAEAERLASVRASGEVTYPNGDRASYLDLTFRFRWLAGDPHPADGENTDARWFPVEAMPEMNEEMRSRVAAALPERGEALFVR